MKWIVKCNPIFHREFDSAPAAAQCIIDNFDDDHYEEYISWCSEEDTVPESKEEMLRGWYDDTLHELEQMSVGDTISIYEFDIELQEDM